jgi:hypothetical protein
VAVADRKRRRPGRPRKEEPVIHLRDIKRPYVTAKEISACYGISVSSVYNYARAKLIPTYNIPTIGAGRSQRHRFPRLEVIDYFEGGGAGDQAQA